MLYRKKRPIAKVNEETGRNSGLFNHVEYVIEDLMINRVFQGSATLSSGTIRRVAKENLWQYMGNRWKMVEG